MRTRLNASTFLSPVAKASATCPDCACAAARLAAAAAREAALISALEPWSKVLVSACLP